jgi:CelD/BcsL family acetyltransferase involved in cellulose biosynthesis
MVAERSARLQSASVDSPKMRAELLEDVGRLEEIASEWDELAVAAGRPYASPHWLIPWWESAAPDGARLRTVVVRDDQALVCVAPFLVGRGLWGARIATPLGRGVSARVEPLARDGYARGSAGLIARTLAESRPAPGLLMLEAVPASSMWAPLLAESWPGSARLERSAPAPIVHRPPGGYAEWFAARSGHFRKRMRRATRELEERGASFRLAGSETFSRDLEAFARLHRARWSGRGGSGILTESVERMVTSAAERLGENRFRIWVLELDGRPVAVEILVAAGGTATFWLGGFEAEHGRLQPSIQIMLRAIEHAFEVGDDVVDLGEGGQDFKYRLADGEEELAWFAIVGRGAGALPIRGRLAAMRVRRKLAGNPLAARARRTMRSWAGSRHRSP